MTYRLRSYKGRAAVLGAEKPFKLEDILRRVLFVAPSMRALDLLLQMRRRRSNGAGGRRVWRIDGLVTIETWSRKSSASRGRA